MTAVIYPSQTKKELPTRGLQSSSQIWTQQKGKRDSELWGNSERLWIVENKIYDLTKFTLSHPGGSQWIQLTKGQDISQHFVIHHLNEKKARVQLQKYYVKQVDHPKEQRYSFKEEGLYRRIKKKLLQEFRPEQLQNYNKSILDGIFFIAVWVFLFVLASLYHSCFLACLCGLSIYPLLGIAHNFVHVRPHPFRFLWMVTGLTHREWQQMHCISHHIYTNTLLDYQIQIFEPLVYFLTIKPKNTLVRVIAKEILIFTSFLLNIILKLILIPLLKRKKPDPRYLIPLLQIPISYILTQDLFLSLKLFVITHITISYLFVKTTFTGHRTGREWTEGNEQIRDFAEHQILTSSDVQTDGSSGILSYTLHAGFNYHAIHHLFPTIDNHFLPQADRILTAEAAKAGVKKNVIKQKLRAVLEVDVNLVRRREWRRSE